MDYKVVYAPEAEEQLAALYRYIAERSFPNIAERYTNLIISYCEELRHFPHRGAQRDDLRPGLRTTNYKGNAVIAFSIDDDQREIAILGVFYGGQDYESKLRKAQS